MSPVQAWILAGRPRTLPAAAAPVVVGTAAAIADQKFVFTAALAAGMVTLFLQVGVNLANDYFDHKHGIDTAERLGPQRVTQSGLLQPESVKKAMLAVFIVLLFMLTWREALIAGIAIPITFLGAIAVLWAMNYSIKGEVIATVAEVSKKLLSKFDIKQQVYMANVNWYAVLKHIPRLDIQYKAVSKYPSVRREIR